jgi:hypothetical protein
MQDVALDQHPSGIYQLNKASSDDCLISEADSGADQRYWARFRKQEATGKKQVIA